MLRSGSERRTWLTSRLVSFVSALKGIWSLHSFVIGLRFLWTDQIAL
jgi:hypothetical protein